MQDTTSLKLRSTTMEDDEIGIDDSTMNPSSIDLGTIASPGMNSIRASNKAWFLGGSPVDLTVYAVGNEWNPNVQGADATGAYSSQIIECSCNGANFYGGGANVSIQL